MVNINLKYLLKIITNPKHNSTGRIFDEIFHTHTASQPQSIPEHFQNIGYQSLINLWNEVLFW